jgi:hypothetical protein
MEMLLRIGMASDPVQNKFNAEEATVSYYNLAPFHTEFKHHHPSIFKPETPPHPFQRQ